MPPIFTLLQEWGGVAWPEMYRTFNMGIGMILVVPADEADAVRRDLSERGEQSSVIGQVTPGERDVSIRGGVFR
jgi:phosphoribosylformylglycinamidine cyclo-ligase